jgi:ATP-dependent exoDNAse (exonuclease V) beta subunit
MPPKGFKMSPEQKAKISAAQTGKKRAPFSEEWRRKIGDASRGRKMPPRTEEHRRKLREAYRASTRAIGECVICGRIGPRDQDHDHVTGQVRGLLCRRCNLALGHLLDDPILVHRAAAYLDEWRAKE